MFTVSRIIAVLAAGSLVAACSDGTSSTSPTGPSTSEAAVSGVSPAGGATGVAPTTPVVVSFDHPMMPAMPPAADLHRGDLSGPVVAGHWAWSDGDTHLTFMPDSAFATGTRYTIHIGGGMRDSTGQVADLDWACQELDGQWAGGGGGHGGMMNGSSDMGPQWQDRHGTYGAAFSFTTR